MSKGTPDDQSRRDELFSGRIIVVSGPSGTGKSTLVRDLVREHPDKVTLSVSFTTRAPRLGEKEGEDYVFVKSEEFQRLADKEMLESSEVDGHLYGTSARRLKQIRREGLIPILVIDVTGWKHVKDRMPEAVGIFVLPPSIRVLWSRLVARESRLPDNEQLWRRLLHGKDEICRATSLGYHWYIVNHDGRQKEVLGELRRIIIEQRAGQCGLPEGQTLCDRLLQEYETLAGPQTFDETPS